MPNVTIDNVRISYPHLFVAKKINSSGAPKYSAAFLIPATHPKLHELFEVANTLINEKYPDGQLPRNFKGLPCYDAQTNPKYVGNDAYAGMWVLNSSKNADQGAPEVVDPNMQALIQPGKIYPGLIVNVAVSVYIYEPKDEKGNVISRGITTGLEAIQIVKDGPRMDNKPSVDELFQPIPVSGGPAGGPGGAVGGPGKFNPLG